MKKSTMIAALIAASAFSAMAADVYSRNIVGYNKVTIEPGLNMVSATFGQIGDGTAQNFQEIFVDEDGVAVGGVNSTLADNIITWDPTVGAAGAYTTYYKYYDGESPEYDNVWYFDNDNEITEPIATSTGFWYNSLNSTAVVMTVVGEVNTNATVSITIEPGLNLVSFPFPTGFAINSDVDWAASGAQGGVNSTLADNIITWDPTVGAAGAYTTYYMYYDGESPEYDNVWYFDNDNEIVDAIPASSGFWYLHLGTGFTLTFDKPY